MWLYLSGCFDRFGRGALRVAVSRALVLGRRVHRRNGTNVNAKEIASTLASTQAAIACLQLSGDSTSMSTINSFSCGREFRRRR